MQILVTLASFAVAVAGETTALPLPASTGEVLPTRVPATLTSAPLARETTALRLPASTGEVLPTRVLVTLAPAPVVGEHPSLPLPVGRPGEA